MSDFLSGLGGIIKGMQPLMGEEARNDASMNAFLLQSDVSGLESKRTEVLARIGEAVCAQRSSGKYAEFSSLCDEAAEIEKQLAAKRAEVAAAKKAAEQQQLQKQLERNACICGSCGFENEPGTKFCGECGGKLALPEKTNCQKCGAVLLPGKKFCGECGERL